MAIVELSGLDYSQAISLAVSLGLMVRYTVISTKFGWLGMGGSEAGLSFITLPRPSAGAVLVVLEDSIKDAVEDACAFGDLPYRLQRYFDGEKVAFPDRLDLSGATAFQQAVWNTTRSIPYGENRSYAWVARKIGSTRAGRAVGGALARNRLPIIVPCHRVVASGGGLGGFSGGLELKRRLLELEDGRLDTEVLTCTG